jgi:hypothetical protein
LLFFFVCRCFTCDWVFAHRLCLLEALFSLRHIWRY